MATELEKPEARKAKDKGATTKAAGSKKKSGFAHKLYTGELSYDFVGRRKVWYIVSLVLIVVSVLAVSIRGLNLGVEFTGGTTFTVNVANPTDQVDKARQIVTDTGLPDLDDVQAVAVGDSQVRVQARTMSTDEVGTVRSALAKGFGVTVENVSSSTVGKSWGEQITEKGIQALVIFLVLVMLLIWAYFRDWKMSIAAIIALAHDLIITVGIYALTGFTVTPASLIGLLTILGYSLYDNMVVFDKVRENVRGITKQNRSYAEAANLAVNQTVVRSINTTIIGVLPVAALLFAGTFVLGSGPLEDLGLALFVGMIAGAYSSIFIATPLLVQMREREPAMIEHAKHLERRKARGDSGPAQVKVTTVVAESEDVGELVEDSRVSIRRVSDEGPRIQPTRSTRSSRKK